MKPKIFLFVIGIVLLVGGLENIQIIDIFPEKLASVIEKSHLGTLTISGTTELCGNYNNVWDTVYVTSTGILNICARNATDNTGFVNITLGTAGNFTVAPGGLINGTARGSDGVPGTTSTSVAALQGTNGNNWSAGTNSTAPNGGAGGGASRDDASNGAGGGGGGFGGAGGSGGVGTASTGEVAGTGGLIYGQADNLTLHSGSGGGGAAGDATPGKGGQGGAGFKVNAGLGIIRINGFVNLSGWQPPIASGQDSGGGGGGGGGNLILYASNITVDSAILNVSGGRGGDATAAASDDGGGGGGGGGRIYLVYSTISNTSVTTIALGGAGGQGAGGGSTGTAGTITHNDTDATFADNAPQWVVGSPSTNNSNPAPNAFVSHNVNWTDDGELFFATLEVNGTGASCDTTANVTSNVIIGMSNWSNLTWQIPTACSNKAIGWRIYVRDFPSNQTNVTALQSYQVQEITDTCTYPGSGNWNILCSDNCNISSNVNLQGNNITLDGSGLITISANISNWRVGRSSGSCLIRSSNGGGFKA